MRVFAPMLIAAVLAASCGDDGAASSAPEASVPTSTSTPVPESIVGPTTSSTVPSACLELAERYVATSAMLFQAGSPSDDLVEQTRSDLEDLDVLASAGGCGEGYRVAVCDGLDELTLAGTLVIYQMLTARCI